MGNEPNKQQGQPGQQGQGTSQSHQQGQQSHQQGQGQPGQQGRQGQDVTGTADKDKWQSNQPQPGGSTQDTSKKDPTRQSGTGERNEQEESDQGSRRRAS
jgi:hypothetical protein